MKTSYGSLAYAAFQAKLWGLVPTCSSMVKKVADQKKQLTSRAAGTTIRVGSDFCGLGTFALATHKMPQKLGGSFKMQHCFSSDKFRASRAIVMNSKNPPDVPASLRSNINIYKTQLQHVDPLTNNVSKAGNTQIASNTDIK